MNNALIVFLKYPNPGHVKTRLAKDVGDELACSIYQSLAEHVIRNIFLKKQRTYDVRVFFTPADKENEIKVWLKPLLSVIPGADVPFISQEGNDLGDRMSNAFKKTLQGSRDKKILTKHHSNHNRTPLSMLGERSEREETQKLTKGHPCGHEDKISSSHHAIIIGTDCSEIDAALIESAFEVLQGKDIVIGPCKDGGYYLIGMASYVPDLFVDIDWSTNRVFTQTIEKMQKNNLSYGILKTLTDIDRIEDLYERKDFSLR